MRKPYPAIAVSLIIAVALATAVAAQPPRFVNARVTAQAAGPPLAASFRTLVAAQPDVTWIGYSVPILDGNRTMCCGCWSGSGSSSFVSGTFVSDTAMTCAGCRLEPTAGSTTSSIDRTAQRTSGPVKLEGPDRMFVLFRIAERRVERIRVFSEDCELDAGGRPVIWLDAVNPAESVTLLASYVGADADRRIANGALSAVALHADPAANGTLERLARRHDSSRIRGEAIFWLAQRAGQKAAGVITESIDQDPDTEVKKRAVFALGQLPKDEGVPLLIRVARTHANPAVRKQAMFWLGQSKDARAIDFFAEILK
jgi:hypothetical protein